MRFLSVVFLLLSAPVLAETVVFEPGLGDGRESFQAIADRLSVPVFLNQRPRRMPTDNDGLRTGNETADYLYSQLQAAGAKPPYYLVAHSIGSMTALSFAAAHPNETGGILLVDGRMPNFKQRCELDGARPCKIPSAMMMLMGRAQKAEIRGFDATNWPDPRTLGTIPLWMLISNQNPMGVSANYRDAWQNAAVEFSAPYAQTRLTFVEADHYIHHARPELVLGQIQELMATQ